MNDPEESRNSLEMNENDRENKDSNINVKVPKRILHFSDGNTESDFFLELLVILCFNSGIIEEFSSDEDEVDSGKPDETKESNWLLRKMKNGGSKVLNVVDYVGEGLAEFLGITTPKYILEIEEHKQRKIQMELRAKEDLENDWSLTTNTENNDNSSNIVTTAPTSNNSNNEIPAVHKF
jgi:hypothetical protein